MELMLINLLVLQIKKLQWLKIASSTVGSMIIY
jgi:hypothetical protein